MDKYYNGIDMEDKAIIAVIDALENGMRCTGRTSELLQKATKYDMILVHDHTMAEYMKTRTSARIEVARKLKDCWRKIRHEGRSCNNVYFDNALRYVLRLEAIADVTELLNVTNN